MEVSSAKAHYKNCAKVIKKLSSYDNKHETEDDLFVSTFFDILAETGLPQCCLLDSKLGFGFRNTNKVLEQLNVLYPVLVQLKKKYEAEYQEDESMLVGEYVDAEISLNDIQSDFFNEMLERMLMTMTGDTEIVLDIEKCAGTRECDKTFVSISKEEKNHYLQIN